MQIWHGITQMTFHLKAEHKADVVIISVRVDKEGAFEVWGG